LKFVVQHFEKDKDPAKHLNILQTLRWGIAAWDEITPVTINNCWLKSRVLAPKLVPQTRQEALTQEETCYNATISQINTAIQVLAKLGRIKKAMNIKLFLEPDAEAVDDPEEDIFEQIAEAYIDSNYEPESNDKN